MSLDITGILKDWDYAAEEVRVRVVPGDDGREKLQLRVDMGVVQMEFDGRPDGFRPEGFESWFAYYEDRRRHHGTTDDAAFVLDEEACIRLWREGIQYHQRYISFRHLKLHDLCVRDTERTLRLLEFIKRHAPDEPSRRQFDQWRPYVLMLHAMAMTEPMVEQSHLVEAIRIVDAAIGAIRDFLEEYEQSDRADQCAELTGLERWREEIHAIAEQSQDLPASQQTVVLHRKLQAAVSNERFEEAARLRDEIRRLAELQDATE